MTACAKVALSHGLPAVKLKSCLCYVLVVSSRSVDTMCKLWTGAFGFAQWDGTAMPRTNVPLWIGGS